MTGIGVEIAKNIILTGPKSVQIWDPKNIHKIDVESNFYANSQDLNKNRTRTVLHKLAELNPYVEVGELPAQSLSQIDIQQLDVVVVADLYPKEQVIALNNKLHSLNKGFIMAVTLGMSGCIFVDFGKQHTIFDVNGENPIQGVIHSINDKGEILVSENERHRLYKNDWVTFKEIVGLEKLNGKTFQV